MLQKGKGIICKYFLRSPTTKKFFKILYLEFVYKTAPSLLPFMTLQSKQVVDSPCKHLKSSCTFSSLVKLPTRTVQMFLFQSFNTITLFNTILLFYLTLYCSMFLSSYEGLQYQIWGRNNPGLQWITVDVIGEHDNAAGCCTAHDETQTHLIHKQRPAIKSQSLMTQLHCWTIFTTHSCLKDTTLDLPDDCFNNI